MMAFDRENYYSQTELTRTFKISVKGVKELILAHQLEVVAKDINLGEFNVTSVYLKKDEIDKLQLQKR